tara:strand:+ start:3027 stop:3755 length:729 start_codon:yes stop_codon:yes gene_type:complete
MAEWMEELRKLDRLREDSLITEEEYEKQKALLIPSENSNVKPYSLLGLGKAVSILSGLSAVAGLITLIAFAYRASLLTDIKNGKYVSWSEGDDADAFVGAASSFEFLIGIPLLVVLIIWAWRATVNIESSGRSGRWSRGWAIGGWFTPVMFLFVPYQIISDAWKKAANNTESEGRRNKFWLAGFIFWWASVAFAIFGGIVSEGDSIDDGINGDVIIALSGGLGVIAGIVIAVAFNQMSKRHA